MPRAGSTATIMRERPIIGRMAIPSFIAVIVVLVVLRLEPASSISPGQLDKLTKQQIFDLDNEISDYWTSNYESLDRRNISYDQQLYRTLRAIRHTVVVDLYDFKYSDDSIRERSAGHLVDDALCRRQLSQLAELAQMQHTSKHVAGSLPLTVRHYLESKAKTPQGILDGNVVWLGVYDSCVRANIPAGVIRGVLGHEQEQKDIKGRYCVSHMRAKSWPKWDMYFEDRLSIRVGICMPQSCHSKIYKEDTLIQQQVNYLTRYDLVDPFNDDSRYEVYDLYCLPDEDSPFRQPDLGAKLFKLFLLIWIGILIYTNIKYKQRTKALRRLRETVDIKMIVSEKADREDTDHIDDDPGEPINDSEVKQLDSPEVARYKREYANNKLAKQFGKTSKSNKDESDVKFDFVQAFSIEANIDYLFKSRAGNEADDSALKRSKTKDSNDGPNEADENALRNEKKSRVNLDVLDAVKVFSAIYIVLGHCFMFYFDIIENMRHANEQMMGVPIVIIANSLHVVQLFYIIAGVLLTFLILSRQKRRHIVRPPLWIVVIVGRYLRMIPVYLLVFWFAKHVGPHVSFGPTWLDYRTDLEGVRGYCATESWLTMLTLSSADAKLPLGCLPQTWYLSNDFRTLLVLPIYLITLAM